MRWVQQAMIRPHRCAAVPYIGNSSTNKGFIDTGSELDGFDNHVYISVEWVEAAARFVGFEPEVVAQGLRTQLEAKDTKIAATEERAADLQRQLDAIHTLKLAGATSARRPGRPAKEKVAA